MDIEKLIESAEHCDLGDCANCPSCDRVCCKERTMGELAREVKRLQAENEKLRDELEQVKRCIEIVENQRDSAIKELENYMVQDVLDGNEPCAICAKASDTPCEYCNPKWRGQKEE
jgi:predicted RNase H-like nuclease (RuvC/YqgF family)